MMREQKLKYRYWLAICFRKFFWYTPSSSFDTTFIYISFANFHHPNVYMSYVHFHLFFFLSGNPVTLHANSWCYRLQRSCYVVVFGRRMQFSTITDVGAAHMASSVPPAASSHCHLLFGAVFGFWTRIYHRKGSIRFSKMSIIQTSCGPANFCVTHMCCLCNTGVCSLSSTQGFAGHSGRQTVWLPDCLIATQFGFPRNAIVPRKLDPFSRADLWRMAGTVVGSVANSRQMEWSWRWEVLVVLHVPPAICRACCG